MIAGVAIAAVATLLSYTVRSFASLANYSDLNRSSMRALDYLTRDVRAATGITSFTTNQIVFNMGTNSPSLTYTYSATNKTLTRIEGTASKVLLVDCNRLTFSFYQRTPIAGTYDQYPLATDKAGCKVLVTDWTCTKNVLGKVSNTQHSQTAKIVLRKA